MSYEENILNEWKIWAHYYYSIFEGWEYWLFESELAMIERERGNGDE